jgi:hypothetical protein
MPVLDLARFSRGAARSDMGWVLGLDAGGLVKMGSDFLMDLEETTRSARL